MGMNKVAVTGAISTSEVLIGESLSNVQNYIAASNVFIITDVNVQKAYGGKFPQFPVFAMESGESAKSIDHLLLIYTWLLDNGADRSSFVLGIGGGVVCDVAGFVASTYMRGVDFGFVATTLLAQVDASVGGKNGVDLNGYKNIIGTFNLPKFVICDTSLLVSLPKNELSNGLAEMVKHAIIADPDKFAYMEANADKLMACDVDVLTALVTKSVQIKANVVSADEREHGIRKTLNLGHTWGHAVEKISQLPHGCCVSVGLVYAAELSVARGVLSSSESSRICRLLDRLGLPTSTNIDPEKIFRALAKDKKKIGNAVDFVLIRRIGEVFIQRLTFNEVVL